MNIEDFSNQIVIMREKERAQKIWELWLVKLTMMNEDNFISYEDMLNMSNQQETKGDININGYYVDQCFF